VGAAVTDAFAAELARLTPDQRRLLMQRIRQRRSPTPDGPAPRPGEKTAPLSSAQERLWLLDQLAPGEPTYNVAVTIRITGNLDLSALDHAVSAVVARQDALRTVVRTNHGGQPRQEIIDRMATLRVDDLREAPESTVSRVAREHGAQRFDLRSGPLYGFRLLRLGDREHLLLAVVHHMVFDAASAGVLAAELAAAYRGSPLQELPVSFGDYCAWEQQQRATYAAEQLPYWIDQLRDAPPLCTLPTDRPRPDEPGHRAERHAFALPAPMAAELAALCAAEGVSLYSGLLTGFALTLRQFGAGDRIITGVPASSRTHTSLESLIGCFYNPQALLIDFSGEPTRRAALRRAHATVREAQAHQAVPFADVVNAVRPKRVGRHNPLFQAMLSLIDQPMAGWDARGTRFELASGDTGATDMDLFVTTSRRADGGLNGTFRYNAALYRRATIEAAAGTFGETLRRLCADPDLSIGPAPSAAESVPMIPAVPYRPPLGARETTLAAIWAQILGVPHVGVDDNFFQLGGDSMQVIQMVTAAAEAGLALRPQDVVASPTVAALARAQATPARSGARIRGPVPFSPAQRWFFTEVAPRLVRPEDYCHAYYVRLDRDIEQNHIRRAVAELVARHDALRLRVTASGLDLGGVVPFTVRQAPPAGEAELATQERAALRFDEGLARVLHLPPDRLLLLCHHLVVDGLSRTIVLEDLRTLLTGGEPMATSPYVTWATALPDYARGLDSQLPFWRAQRNPAVLPKDGDRRGGRAIVRRALTAGETSSLSRGNLGDQLLTVTAQTIARFSGRDQCALALSTPGRDAPLAGVDVSRTVGWLQSFYPLVLPSDPVVPLVEAIPAVRASINAAPHGLGWGLLRYLNEDQSLAEMPSPEVSFNWLGGEGFEHAGRASDLLTVLEPPLTPAATRGGRSAFPLDVSGSVHHEQIGFRIGYSTSIHDQSTVEMLADEIRDRLLRSSG
jgi:non-ribosomal peptide synthase protein (TIGR01720 family)